MLYRSLIDHALGSGTDSLMATLGSLTTSAATKDNRPAAYRLFLLGYYQFKQEHIDSAHVLFSGMLRASCDTARDAELIVLQQGGLTLLELYKGTSPAVFRKLMPMLDLNAKYPSRYSWWVYSLAAQAWFGTGDMDKSESFLRLARSIIPDTTDYRLRARFMANFCRIEIGWGNFDKALRYEDSTFAFAKMAGDQKMMALSTSKKGLLYIDMGQLEKGYKLQMEALAQIKKLQSQFMSQDLMSQNINLAQTFFKKNQFGLALEYARAALLMGGEKGNTVVISDAYSILSDAFQKLGQYDSSLIYLREAYEARLKYNKQLAEKEIAELDVKHELDREQQKSAALAGRNKLLRAQIIGAVFTMTSGIVLVFVIGRGWRLRRRFREMELQLQLLRSRMDPHFIYNSLFAIQDLISSNQNERAIYFLQRFAGLSRVSLDHSGKPFVRLHKEMEALKDYLSLQELRLRQLFEYQIQFYEDYEEDFDILIPPMLIQPFAENAIEHGIRMLDKPGQITIVLKKTEGLIICQIEDNGKGFIKPIAAMGKPSIAIENTRQRLRILGNKYKRKAGLHFIEKEKAGLGSGVIVTLSIPYQVTEYEIAEGADYFADSATSS